MQKLALVSSPILGFFNMIPILILLQANASILEIYFEIDFIKIILGTLLSSGMIYLNWQLNIWVRYSLNLPFLKKKDAGKYLFSFIAIIFFSLGIILLKPENEIETFDALNLFPLFTAITNNLFIWILINLAANRYEKTNLELEKERLEISSLIAKQEQLKQQIQPHFLFNCLSNLNTLIKKDPPRAEDYSLRLSGFLRFSLDLGQLDITSIRDEISFLEVYLELQKVRFGNSIELDNRVPIEIQNTRNIPVFTLQILVENALKHNSFSIKEPIIIRLDYNEQEQIIVSNNIIRKRGTTGGTGIGLENLNERSKLSTGFEIEVNHNQEDVFEVKVKSV